MKRINKICFLGAMLAVVMVLMGGCGAKPAPTNVDGGSTPKAEAPAGKTEISFWNGFGGSDRATLEAIVKRYNDTSDKYFINMEIMDWELVYQKLATSASSNQGPDMICFGPENIATYANMGAIVPVNDFYEAKMVDETLFPATFKDMIKYKGDYIGIPMNFFNHCLFYNKDLATAAGLDAENPPKTWDELAVWAKAMTDEANSQYGLFTPTSWVNLVQHIWANGGDIMDYSTKTATINSPEAVEAVTFFSDLYKAGVSPATSSDGGQIFMTGKLGMMIDGPWQTPQLKEAGVNYGIALVPSGPKKHVTFGAGLSFHLTAKGAKKDETKAGVYDFAQWWFSKDVQKEWSSGVAFPPIRTDMADDAELIAANPDLAVFLESGKIAQPWFLGIVNSQKILSDVTGKYFDEIFLNNADVQEALDKANADLDKILATER